MSWDSNTERLSDAFLEVYLPDANVDVDEPEWTMPFPDRV